MTKQEAWKYLYAMYLKSFHFDSRAPEALDALKPPPDEPQQPISHSYAFLYDLINQNIKDTDTITIDIDSRIKKLEDQLATHRMAEHHTHEERITPKFVVPKPHDDRPYPYNQIYKQAR